MKEDEMVEWHYQLNGHEYENASGDGEEPGNLLCGSPWGCNESDTTEKLKNNNNIRSMKISQDQVSFIHPCSPS